MLTRPLTGPRASQTARPCQTFLTPTLQAKRLGLLEKDLRERTSQLQRVQTENEALKSKVRARRRVDSGGDTCAHGPLWGLGCKLAMNESGIFACVEMLVGK